MTLAYDAFLCPFRCVPGGSYPGADSGDADATALPASFSSDRHCSTGFRADGHHQGTKTVTTNDKKISIAISKSSARARAVN